MSWTVLQLGYGMQGKASLSDILKNRDIKKIIVCDISKDVVNLNHELNDERIIPLQIDVSDGTKILQLMRGADIVIDLLSGEYASYAARLAVKAGANLVSSMYLYDPGEQDPAKSAKQKREIEELGREAREKGLTLVEEFGMDPGMDLVLGARAIKEMDEVQVFHSYGAGFPELAASHNPLRYKFTWSISGVMRSYLRPSTILDCGCEKRIKADAMFDRENMHYLRLNEFASELECFANGNCVPYAEKLGISKTVSSMGRYICRWPGTGEFWRVMAKSGFLSSKEIKVGEYEIAPIDFCAKLLGSQRQFYYEDHERDIALIRSDVRGYKDGKPVRVIYQIIDKRDPQTGFTAMQRTVGYTVSIGAQMVLDGRISKKGIVNPVEIPFDSYIEELQKRGIVFTSSKEVWDKNEKP